ncbi:MAG: glutathione S-transferase family protein [Phenylobacterium sp.]
MKLFCDPISTTSRPVMLFIAEHGLDVELIHIDLMSGGNQAVEYLAVNPNGIVPFLVDGDLSLGESTAILRYLSDKAGCAAYPRDGRTRAKVDEALGWFSTNLHEYFCLFTIYPSFGIPHGIDPDLASGMIAFGTIHSPRWLTVLDQHMIGDRDFVCGDEITLADYLGAAFVTIGDAAAYDFGPYPNIRRWLANMRSLQHWDATYATFDAFVASPQPQAKAA